MDHSVFFFDEVKYMAFKCFQIQLLHVIFSSRQKEQLLYNTKSTVKATNNYAEYVALKPLGPHIFIFYF